MGGVCVCVCVWAGICEAGISSLLRYNESFDTNSTKSDFTVCIEYMGRIVVYELVACVLACLRAWVGYWQVTYVMEKQSDVVNKYCITI